MVKLILATAQAMEDLGARIAKSCEAGAIVYLCGELGAGKTTFVRGFLRGENYQGNVRSPTFNIFEFYSLASMTIVHFDLYRIANIEELEYIGISDYFNGKNICLIEWPQRGVGFLPSPDINCKFDFTLNDSERLVKLVACTVRGYKILSNV